MKITLLTDNPKSWIIPFVKDLQADLNANGHEVRHINNLSDVTDGDIMFLLSCERIVPPKILKHHKNNIVIHPSALPQGKGHSPLAWQILDGQNTIPVTLFEAVDAVDAGDIYMRDVIRLEGHELNDEIKELQGRTTIKMVKSFLKNYAKVSGEEQSGEDSFYPKRTAKDSELDIHRSINDQFNLLRVVDNDRYPAFFIKDGRKYILKIHKEDT